MARMNKRERIAKRHRRVRRDVFGTLKRPRLSVFKSLNHVYAQLIDDVNGVTLASASSLENEIKSKADITKTQKAEEVGRKIAERALGKGIESVVFDRGGFRYHGRIKALAEAARLANLKF
ncbi:MAG: 50S ribosomal protein L18 [Nitrospiraceae bacterium]|nr:50S ribosomal protein L18 [Nitrospiraceae bacterium]